MIYIAPKSINPLDSKGNYIVPHRIIRSRYTLAVRWWVSCYIWYSKEEPGGCGPTKSPRGCTKCNMHNAAHPSTASVPITVWLLYDGPLLCGFNVALKGLQNHGANRQEESMRIMAYNLIHVRNCYDWSRNRCLFMSTHDTPSTLPIRASDAQADENESEQMRSCWGHLLIIGLLIV